MKLHVATFMIHLGQDAACTICRQESLLTIQHSLITIEGPALIYGQKLLRLLDSNLMDIQPWAERLPC